MRLKMKHDKEHFRHLLLYFEKKKIAESIHLRNLFWRPSHTKNL